VIVKFAKNATETQVRAVAEQLRAMGAAFVYRRLYGFPVFALNKPLTPEQTFHFDSLPGVEEIIPIEQEYRLASSRWKQERTIIDVRGARIGGDEICVIAGPCAIESEEQIFQTAENLHRLGVKFIRGGAYKPRTSPYSFQGLGKDGLRLIKEAADAYGLRVVTEVMDSSLIDEVLPFADILQVGSRNMQNFYFLKQLGQAEKPILLKRGMQARVDEWLMAAEYLLTYGNEIVIL
jgi:3-deoxy-7-phosphoheptulonate synthase